MPRKVYHVVFNNSLDRWNIKQAGLNFSQGTFNLKEEAIKMAVILAKADKPSQVKIHGLNGKIQNEWTYKNDPRRYLS